MNKLFSTSLILISLAAATVNAAPITYDMVFTPTVGLTPTGQFTYDAALSSGQFSNFIILVNSLSFDFTILANITAPPPLGQCSPKSAAQTFNNLMGECGTRTYSSEPGGGYSGNFPFGLDRIAFRGLPPNPLIEPFGTFNGTYVVTPQVPEPGTISLALCGLAAVVVAAKRRSSRRALPIEAGTPQLPF